MQRFLLIGALLAVVVPGLAASAYGPPSRRVARKQFEVLAHVNPKQDLNGNVRGFRGYAYLASYGAYNTRCEGSGIRVFDLRNPRRPTRVAAFGWADSDPALQGAYADQVRLQHASTPFFRGDLAAIGLQRCRLPTNGTQGFALYDVTRPTRPRKLSIVNTYPSHGSHELWLQAAGNHVYVYTALARSELHTSVNGGPGSPDFQIWDVSNPSAPVKVGQWGIWTNLGIKPTEDEFVHSVITNPSATKAYLSYWDFGTVILDIRDPAHPVLLGRVRDRSKPDAHSHSAALIRHEHVLIETPEYGSFFNFPPGRGYPRFWEISNPAAPRLLTTFSPDPGLGESTVHDTSLHGNRAYFSWYDHGVYAVDVSNPSRPRVTAHFTPPARLDLDNPFCKNCPFVWEAYSYRDYVLVSDVNSGFWVIHVRCSVPALRGLSLRTALVALAEADCRAGRITLAASGRTGHVVAQRPGVGSRPAYPGRVSLTVGG